MASRQFRQLSREEVFKVCRRSIKPNEWTSILIAFLQHNQPGDLVSFSSSGADESDNDPLNLKCIVGDHRCQSLWSLEVPKPPPWWCSRFARSGSRYVTRFLLLARHKQQHLRSWTRCDRGLFWFASLRGFGEAPISTPSSWYYWRRTKCDLWSHTWRAQ